MWLAYLSEATAFASFSLSTVASSTTPLASGEEDQNQRPGYDGRDISAVRGIRLHAIVHELWQVTPGFYIKAFPSDDILGPHVSR